MKFFNMLFLLTALVISSKASAGAKLKVNDQTTLDLGMLLQAQYLDTKTDLDSTPSTYEKLHDYRVKRARVRLKGDIGTWVSAFIQTEFSEEPNISSADQRIIDAYLQIKTVPLFNIYIGENMVPSARQIVTGSGALMAIDRPSLAYKTLTWGVKSLYAFNNYTYSDSEVGFVGDVGVRDMGVTLFGSDSLTDWLHFKYYLGSYDGVQEARPKDQCRYAARVQVNFGDAESGYYNDSTYFDDKSTIGIGLSYDRQADVARDTVLNKNIDYKLFSADFFLDRPLLGGSITYEMAYMKLDLNNATSIDHDGDGGASTATKNGRQAQGEGYFEQLGFMIGNWQPWLAYEKWKANSADQEGNYQAYRVGLNYYLEKHNANIKGGYELFKTDAGIGSTNKKEIGTWVLGAFFSI